METGFINDQVKLTYAPMVIGQGHHAGEPIMLGIGKAISEAIAGHRVVGNSRKLLNAIIKYPLARNFKTYLRLLLEKLKQDFLTHLPQKR